jgi:ribosome maturation factor RimP
MSDNATLNPMLSKVERLIVPIVSDLHLELYDLEFRGGTLRVTIDRPAGVEEGLDLEAIALASRLIGRETRSRRPDGRSLHTRGQQSRSRTQPAHAGALPTGHRQDGGAATARHRQPEGERSERRLQGVLVAADETAATIRLDDAAKTERVVPYDKIDRAKTVFVWGPAPKPGKAPKEKKNLVNENW